MAPAATLIFERAPIALSLQSSDRDDAIEKAVHLWAGTPELIGPLPELVSAVVGRENLHSTAMRGGVAFPHARTPLVTTPLLAIGRLVEPVRFAGDDVWLLFAVASPARATTEHLQLLSWLARRCAASGVLDAVRKAASVAEFRTAFAA